MQSLLEPCLLKQQQAGSGPGPSELGGEAAAAAACLSALPAGLKTTTADGAAAALRAAAAQQQQQSQLDAQLLSQLLSLQQMQQRQPPAHSHGAFLGLRSLESSQASASMGSSFDGAQLSEASGLLASQTHGWTGSASGSASSSGGNSHSAQRASDGGMENEALLLTGTSPLSVPPASAEKTPSHPSLSASTTPTAGSSLGSIYQELLVLLRCLLEQPGQSLGLAAAEAPAVAVPSCAKLGTQESSSPFFPQARRSVPLEKPLVRQGGLVLSGSQASAAAHLSNSADSAAEQQLLLAQLLLPQRQAFDGAAERPAGLARPEGGFALQHLRMF